MSKLVSHYTTGNGEDFEKGAGTLAISVHSQDFEHALYFT